MTQVTNREYRDLKRWYEEMGSNGSFTTNRKDNIIEFKVGKQPVRFVDENSEPESITVELTRNMISLITALLYEERVRIKRGDTNYVYTNEVLEDIKTTDTIFNDLVNKYDIIM